MPTARFAFEGFLPRKGGARTSRLRTIAQDERTTVVYESPHRLVQMLRDLARACGAERPVAVARELTKLHEEVWRGSLAAAIEWAEAATVKGEIVVVLHGAPPRAEPDDAEVDAAVRAALAADLSVRDAAAEVAAALGVARRRAYAAASAARAEPG